MDPMEQAEEEMRRREEENQKDLEDTIGLDDFISRRDLSNRGRDVRPSGKQLKAVQEAASTIVKSSNNRRKTMGDLSGLSDDDDFEILGKSRILLCEGSANKREGGTLFFSKI